MRIIRGHTYHQQYVTGMLFHLSFFKYFSYRRCISQNFFTNDYGKHKRRSLECFMSPKDLMKVRYHALELYSASKLDRASGSHLGARVSTPLSQRYHIPPLFYGDCMGELRKGRSMHAQLSCKAVAMRHAQLQSCKLLMKQFPKRTPYNCPELGALKSSSLSFLLF